MEYFVALFGYDGIMLWYDDGIFDSTRISCREAGLAEANSLKTCDNVSIGTIGQYLESILLS